MLLKVPNVGHINDLRYHHKSPFNFECGDIKHNNENKNIQVPWFISRSDVSHNMRNVKSAVI